MIDIYTILIILWMHWIADFVLQTNWMAQNKSKTNLPLITHVLVYSIPFLYFGVIFALINGIIHGIVDWFTSRWSSKLWKKKDTHNFFVVIGLDQSIHYSTLFLTYIWLVK